MEGVHTNLWAESSITCVLNDGLGNCEMGHYRVALTRLKRHICARARAHTHGELDRDSGTKTVGQRQLETLRKNLQDAGVVVQTTDRQCYRQKDADTPTGGREAPYPAPAQGPAVP